MSDIQALDLFSSTPLRTSSSSLDISLSRVDSLAEPPSPKTCAPLPFPLRPAPCSRTVSAPVYPANPFLVSEAVNRIYLRDRVKRQEFSRASSFSPLSTVSLARQPSVGGTSIHSRYSIASSPPASSCGASTLHRRWYPERVHLPPSIADAVEEPQTPFDDLGLPHNGSEVPFLWKVEEFSCWDMAFRRTVGPLANLLENANLLLSQTGVSLAGMDGSSDPKQMRIVVTILLDEQDVDKVLGVGDIQDAVAALVKQRFTETPALPPIRYWVKEEARMIWEHVKLEGVQTFGGREPKLRKGLKMRDPNGEDEVAALRKYNQSWRLGLMKKIKAQREREQAERVAKAAQRELEREKEASKQAAETAASMSKAEAGKRWKMAWGAGKGRKGVDVEKGSQLKRRSQPKGSSEVKRSSMAEKTPEVVV